MKYKIFLLLFLVLLAMPVYSYDELTADTNTLALYHFEDRTGNIISDETGNNDASKGTGAFFSTDFFVFGSYGINFTGNASSYMNTSTLLDEFSENGSIEFHFSPQIQIKESDGHTEKGILSKINNATNDFQCYFPGNSGKIQCNMRINTTTYAVTSFNRTWYIGQWYHFMYVWGKDGIGLFINDTLEGFNINTTDHIFYGNTSDFKFGSGIDSQLRFVADELRISNVSRYFIPVTRFNIIFRNEDTLETLDNVSVTLFNGNGQATDYGLFNDSAEIFYNDYTNDTIIQLEYQNSFRRYYLNINDYTVNNTITWTGWFPSTWYTYTYAVTDAGTGLPEQNALITLHRYINGSLVVVGQAKTQIDGTGEVLLRPGAQHKLNVSSSGCDNLFEDHTPSTSTPTTQFVVRLTCGDAGSVQNNYLKFINDAIFGCSNSSTQVNCSIYDPNNFMTYSRLLVRKKNLLNWETLCDITNNTNPSNLNCSLGTTTNQTYWYVLYVTLPEGQYPILSAGVEYGTPTAQYGLMGIFIVLLMYLLSILIFRYNPAASITAGAMVLIVSYMFGLIVLNFEYFIGILAVHGLAAYVVRT